MTGAYVAAAASAAGEFFASGPGEAVLAGAGSAAAGTIATKLLAPHSGISIPPPPGAAIIDPAGANAAASERRRAAVAGGLSSTVSGAGNQPGATGPTSGGKGLLGS